MSTYQKGITSKVPMLNFGQTNENVRLKTLDEIRHICEYCYNCDLGYTRTKTVFSDGNPKSKIMLIGEAPGQNEDEKGIPFVGRAGMLLGKILEEEGLSRKDAVYICNTVKCRPPNNRVPTAQEKKACRKYLDAQIQLIRPKVIILCGATAVASMLETKEGITKLRGKWLDGPLGSKMMPIFHPSYLLRNPSEKKDGPKWLVRQDLREIKKAVR